ncbi:hypothetical protein PG984_016235 [Apiospora sp. TS-2023a]
MMTTSTSWSSVRSWSTSNLSWRSFSRSAANSSPTFRVRRVFVKLYDRSYSSTYKDPVPAGRPVRVVVAFGSVKGCPRILAVSCWPWWAPHPDDETRPAHSIPIELLKRRDPILFFDDVVLYESELDDNGIRTLSIRTRVHERRMLLLCRLFMRLDGVVARVRDTRVYVDFETDEAIREYTVKEDTYEELKKAFFMSGLTLQPDPRSTTAPAFTPARFPFRLQVSPQPIVTPNGGEVSAGLRTCCRWSAIAISCTLIADLSI